MRTWHIEFKGNFKTDNRWCVISERCKVTSEALTNMTWPSNPIKVIEAEPALARIKELELQLHKAHVETKTTLTTTLLRLD